MKVVFVVDRFCDIVKRMSRDKYKRDTAEDARKYGLSAKPVFKTELAAWDFILERASLKAKEARDEFLRRAQDRLFALVHRNRLEDKAKGGKQCK